MPFAREKSGWCCGTRPGSRRPDAFPLLRCSGAARRAAALRALTEKVPFAGAALFFMAAAYHAKYVADPDAVTGGGGGLAGRLARACYAVSFYVAKTVWPTGLAGIYQMPQPVDAALVSQFAQRVAPILQANSVHIEGVFVTESAPNTFTRLPVRQGAHVLAWFGTAERRDTSAGWLEQLASLSSLEGQPVSLLDLEPTSRSALGFGPNAARAR